MAEPADEGTLLAAVDLGSNSFHMVVGRAVGGRVVIVRRMKEMVRLRAGLDARGELSLTARKDALACLRRFGRYTRHLPRRNVRAVGTNTLRAARNAAPFLARAQSALGHPVEIINGLEEARLIYAGVNSDLPRSPERRLVVDIGGGSTELVIGEGERPLDLESLPIGSVALSEEHFAGGVIDAARFRAAERAARAELDPVRERFLQQGWTLAIGSSGTVRAAARAASGGREDARTVTRAGVQQLQAECIAAGRIEKLSLAAVGRSRAASLPGGLALLSAVMHALDLNCLRVSQTALREGLLGELSSHVTRGAARPVTLRPR